MAGMWNDCRPSRSDQAQVLDKWLHVLGELRLEVADELIVGEGRDAREVVQAHASVGAGR